MRGVRSSPAPSNNFALAESRATVNFLIHDGKYPLCFRSALRWWLENARKKLLDFAVPPARRNYFPRTTRAIAKEGSAIAWRIHFMYNKKYSRAQEEVRTGVRWRGRGDGKKGDRKNTAKLRSGRHTSPGKLEIARIPMCKAAKAWARGLRSCFREGRGGSIRDT